MDLQEMITSGKLEVICECAAEGAVVVGKYKYLDYNIRVTGIIDKYHHVTLEATHRYFSNLKVDDCGLLIEYTTVGENEYDKFLKAVSEAREILSFAPLLRERIEKMTIKELNA